LKHGALSENEVLTLVREPVVAFTIVVHALTNQKNKQAWIAADGKARGSLTDNALLDSSGSCLKLVEWSFDNHKEAIMPNEK
jgi:hypothetical protein|tara:strand:+ start:316 stop:561 length:246 start_codon:yes stop_codon:yes gene_type:complete